MRKFIKAATDSGNLDVKIREVDSEFSPEDVERITDELTDCVFEAATDEDIQQLGLKLSITFYKTYVESEVTETALGRKEYYGLGASNSRPRLNFSGNSVDASRLDGFVTNIKKYIRARKLDAKKVSSFEEEWGDLPEDVMRCANRLSSVFLTKKLGGAIDLEDGKEFALKNTIYNRRSDWSRPEFSGMATRYLDAIFDFAEDNGMSCAELIDFVKRAKHYCKNTGCD